MKHLVAPAIMGLALLGPAHAQQTIDGKGALAEYEKAMTAVKAEDFATARIGFERACQYGVGAACFNYGLMVAKGRGEPASKAKAANLFRKGCDGRDGKYATADACYNYGVAMEQGWTGAADLATARAYYDRGCELDQPDACFNVGNMQLTGKGGEIDDPAAFVDYQNGCELEHGTACFNAAYMIATKRVAAPADKPFSYYKQRACQFGTEKAC